MILQIAIFEFCEITGIRYQRNANKSQLLRLPGEIRNKIWQFATSGYYVYGPYYEDGWGACSYSTQKFERDISAFQLPQVCRQIYTETATLPYTTNTFILLYSWGKAWTDAMIPAYREAITSIYVDLDYCPTSPAWFLTIAHLLKELPNLGHAQFSAAMVYMVQLVDEQAVDAPETMERCEWQAYMVKKLEEADVHGLTYAFAE